MPSTKPYPAEHYPEKWLKALRLACEQPGLEVEFELQPTSKLAKAAHTKLNAMIRGFKHFPGQDAQVAEAANAGRLRLKKVWDPQAKQVILSVVHRQRPSEAFSAFLEELKRNPQARQKKD